MRNTQENTIRNFCGATATTDNKEREILSWYDLPDSERAYFDYESARESSYIKYRGIWRDVHDMMRSPVAGYWDGYSGDSYFSGVVVKFDEYGDGVRIGTYTS